MITVITPTGERPEAFTLAQSMLQRQTYDGPLTWVVVDDGRQPVPVTLRRRDWRVVQVRPEPHWEPGQNTQGRNLRAGLEAYAGGWLTVWEDDDYYAPDWLERIMAQPGDLVGEGGSRWYNVRYRTWGQLNNYSHCSLRATAMRGRAVEAFLAVLEHPQRYYDFELWAAFDGAKHVTHTKLTVGLKGLPGRPGIAEGHDGKGDWDSSGRRLRDWIGEDAEQYVKFYRGPPPMKADERTYLVLKPFKRYRAGDVAILRTREARLLETLGKVRPQAVEIAEEKPRRPILSPVIKLKADDAAQQAEDAAEEDDGA